MRPRLPGHDVRDLPARRRQPRSHRARHASRAPAGVALRTVIRRRGIDHPPGSEEVEATGVIAVERGPIAPARSRSRRLCACRFGRRFAPRALIVAAALPRPRRHPYLEEKWGGTGPTATDRIAVPGDDPLARAGWRRSWPVNAAWRSWPNSRSATPGSRRATAFRPPSGMRPTSKRPLQRRSIPICRLRSWRSSPRHTLRAWRSRPGRAARSSATRRRSASRSPSGRWWRDSSCSKRRSRPKACGVTPRSSQRSSGR